MQTGDSSGSSLARGYGGVLTNCGYRTVNFGAVGDTRAVGDESGAGSMVDLRLSPRRSTGFRCDERDDRDRSFLKLVAHDDHETPDMGASR